MPSHRPPLSGHLGGDSVLLLLGHVWRSPRFLGEGLGWGDLSSAHTKDSRWFPVNAENTGHGGSLRLAHEVHPRLMVARVRVTRQAGVPGGSSGNSCRMLRIPWPGLEADSCR